MKSLLFVPLLVCLTPLYGALLSTSTTCSATGGPTVTDPTACATSGTFENAYVTGTLSTASVSASVSASYDFSATTFSTKMASTLLAGGNNLPPFFFEGGGQASSNASISVDFATQGAVRPGFVQITWNPTGSFAGPGSGGGIIDFSFDRSVSGGVGGCQLFGYCSEFTIVDPITLGTNFDLTQQMSGEVDTADYMDEVVVQGDLSLRFFEADGTTPVTLVQTFETTPEPTSLVLVGLGLLGLLGVALAKSILCSSLASSAD